MTPVEGLLAFSAAAGLVTLTPGLDTALVLRTAATEGPARAMLAGIGISTGVLVWGLLAAIGLGILLSVSETAYFILRLAGAAYLFYLGAVMLRRAVRPPRGQTAEADPQARPARAEPTPFIWFRRGVLTNLLNPKVGAFYMTFLPQFIPAGANVLAMSLAMAFIHAVEGTLWFVVLVLATQSLARWIRRPSVTRMLDGLTGTVLIGFGLRLVAEARS